MSIKVWYLGVAAKRNFNLKQMTEQRLKELMRSAYLWAKVFQSSDFDEFLEMESIKEALRECDGGSSEHG